MTGWAIGDDGEVDAVGEAESLYNKLEHAILPLYYGKPDAYAAIRRSAISLNGSYFHTQRMVLQYVRNSYLGVEPSKKESPPARNGHWHLVILMRPKLAQNLDSSETIFSPILTTLFEIYREYRENFSGQIATYIPELAKADPAQFGIALATADGEIYEVGDSRQLFTIQSISKRRKRRLGDRLNGK